MNFISIDSTALRTLAYEPDQQRLYLQFPSQAWYSYFGVPTLVFEELLYAASKGSYFNRCIRGRFPYCRVSDPISPG